MSTVVAGIEARLEVQRWSPEQWLAKEQACSELAGRAVTDPLFLSWDWLTLWWRYFGAPSGYVAEILAFHRGGNLVGIAPLYRRMVLRNGVLPARSVQMIGVSWRDASPPISEYLDVIATSADLPEVREECIRTLLAEPKWSEFVVAFTDNGSSWREAFEGLAGGAQHYARELDRSVSYLADLSAGFPAYLRDLHQSTRRSIWNLRRRLGPPESVSLEAAGGADIVAAFQDLNRLHQKRWGRPAFSGSRLEFHQELCRRAAGRGELALSRLRVNGAVVSVLYDIRKGPIQYNIKMAFDPDFSNQVSLGLLHLGYAMESAAEAGVTIYDFLAGPGRHSDFKRHLSQWRQELSSVQMVRGLVPAQMYRWRDRVR